MQRSGRGVRTAGNEEEEQEGSACSRMTELAGSAGAECMIGEAWMSLGLKLCSCESAALHLNCFTEC